MSEQDFINSSLELLEEEITEDCSQKCPYCKYEESYTGDPLDDGEATEVICENCGKEYFLMASISVKHECFKKEVEE
jgi:hypothetical protein